MAWGPFNAGGGGGSSGGTAADISYDNSKSGMPLSSVSTTIPARRAATASTSCWVRSAASLLVWWIAATAARLPRLAHSR